MPSVAVLAATLGAAAWAVYFAALIAVYVTAYHRKVMPCQAAAGWGMAIAFAAALVVAPLAVSWPSAARRASRPAPRVLAWLAAALLALASVAVIWVAVNLTIAGDTAGAWMLTVCAGGAPVAVLLTRLAPPPGAETAIRPLAVPVQEPALDIPANGAGTDVAPPPEAAEVTAPEAPEATEVAAAEVAAAGTAAPVDAPGDAVLRDDAVLDVMPSDVTGLDGASADSSAALALDYQATDPALVSDDSTLVSDEAVTEIETFFTDTAVRDYPLLAGDWVDLLGQRPPRVAVDKGMWDAVLDRLGRRELEVGGVALTVRVPGTLIVLGLVLPKQVQVSGVFCEFRAEEVSRVRDVIDGMADIIDLDSSQVKITWVHTHPGMGPFLSNTDRTTTATWRGFDPEFTPIVLDPLAQRIDQQIGVFDTDNRQIRSLRVIEGLADEYAIGRLKDKLIDAYRDARGTMVLFGGY